MSYLDARSLLSLRIVCCKFYSISSDKKNWYAISWKTSNYTRDINGLKVALKMSKQVLKTLSVNSDSVQLSLTQFIGQIQACHSLKNLVLSKVTYTKKQLTKLLMLPVLHHLHLDYVFTDVVKFVGQTKSSLVTLSIECNHKHMYMLLLEWSLINYSPQNLHLILSPKIKSLQDAVRFCHGCSGNLTIFSPHSQSLLQYHSSILPVMHSDTVPLLTLVKKFDQYSGASYLGSIPDYINTNEFSFYDVCQNLTSLHLFNMKQLIPSNLEFIAMSCSNLIELSVEYCHNVLRDLSGLRAMAFNCCKLKVLNLHSIYYFESSPLNVGHLWEILGTMQSLKTLMIEGYMLEQQSCTTKMPNLAHIYINNSADNKQQLVQFHNRNFFMADMPSLRSFRCEGLRTVSLFSGFSKVLCASDQLTHLYLSKKYGNKFSLPTDPSCYIHLQQLFLECIDFVVKDELVLAFSRCQCLTFVVMNILEIKISNITKLVASHQKLGYLKIHAISFRADLVTQTKANQFGTSLARKAAEQGRNLSVQVKLKHDWNEVLDTFPFSMRFPPQ